MPKVDRGASDELRAARQRIAELEARVARIEAENAELRANQMVRRGRPRIVEDCEGWQWGLAKGTWPGSWTRQVLATYSGYTPKPFAGIERSGLADPDAIAASIGHGDRPIAMTVPERGLRTCGTASPTPWLGEPDYIRQTDAYLYLGPTSDTRLPVMQQYRQLADELAARRAAAAGAARRRLRAEIAAHRRTRDELKRARTAAQAANLTKGRFLATTSHELRTPLNAIIGMADLLSQTELPVHAAQSVNTIIEAAQSLLHLVDDILDFAQIKAGCLKLDAVSFCPGDLLTSTVEASRVRAAAKGIDLTLSGTEDLPDRVCGDPKRLRQVLRHLLDNAIKFNDRGRVSVAAVQTRGPGDSVRIRFAVCDQGIGIARSTQEQIFEPFIQADASPARRAGGTGLGLPLCQGLVGLMGGQLEVASVLGRGSRFWFTVDFAHAASSAADTTAQQLPPLAARRASPQSVPALSNRRILVAEDTRINQLVITAQLRKLGFQADVAENGIEVLTALAQERYDLVLMDCDMPELDGYEATRRIRALDTVNRHVPIVALTADATREALDGCCAAGMNGYLTKPCHIRTLRTVIDRWLHR